jgi:hypothetical protein
VASFFEGLKERTMLEIIAIFFIALGTISLFTSYSIAGFIYSLLIMSILVVLVGAVKGKPNGSFSDEHS